MLPSIIHFTNYESFAFFWKTLLQCGRALQDTHRVKVAIYVIKLNDCNYTALNFLPWEFLLLKKLEIEKTKTSFIISVLKVVGILKSVHFKKTVAQSTFLSKVLSFSLILF